MIKIYTSFNNGVAAFVTEPIYQRIGIVHELMNRAVNRRSLGNSTTAFREQESYMRRYPRPIFTFSDAEDLEPYVTGGALLGSRLRAFLVNQRNAVFYDLSGDQSFHVPFSNGYERDSRRGDAYQSEILFRTTVEQLVDEFGLFAPLPNPGESRIA